jgi:uncharacterized protein YdeI (YjbR/CyaY-like superfamily)
MEITIWANDSLRKHPGLPVFICLFSSFSSNPIVVFRHIASPDYHMGTKDFRIDAYIAESADFAKPVLNHLRRLVHAACPEVEETMKWSMPFFMHKGILCNMAAFKSHSTFGFWKGALIFGKNRNAGTKEGDAMGQFGRITSISDLPAKEVMIGYVRKAVQLNDVGTRLPARPRSKEKKELVVPDYIMAALKKNKWARTTFEDFSYSHKKEYVEWITEAKREETRNQRLTTAIAWMATGKSRHWKHVKC